MKIHRVPFHTWRKEFFDISPPPNRIAALADHDCKTEEIKQ